MTAAKQNFVAPGVWRPSHAEYEDRDKCRWCVVVVVVVGYRGGTVGYSPSLQAKGPKHNPGCVPPRPPPCAWGGGWGLGGVGVGVGVGGVLGPAHLALSVREDRLPAVLWCAEVHEHRHDALTTILNLGVDGVVEVVVVGLILLTINIPQDLQTLLVV